MALVIADRVRETSTTTGTGTLTLDGAVTGFRTFGSAIGSGNTCYYTITLGADWEVGLGTVGTGTLARTTVLKSSNSNSAVNFGAGTKDVFVTYTAEKAITTDTGVSKTSSTGSALLPTGTTAERDGSPSAGYIRFNTTDSSFEGYDGSAWGAIGGGATTLTVTNRSGSGVSVSLTNGFLPVTNRAGSTVNVPVT
jgi:hypothetical protein